MRRRALKVVLEKCEEGGYVAFCPALKGCLAQGETEGEAIKNLKDAINLYVDELISGEIKEFIDGIISKNKKKISKIDIEERKIKDVPFPTPKLAGANA